METLRERIKKELQRGDLTIHELCELLNIDDEFDMSSCVADLESTGNVCLKSFKTCYQPDGCAIYIAQYGVK